MNVKVSDESQARPSELAALVLLCAVARNCRLVPPYRIEFSDDSSDIAVHFRHLVDMHAWVDAVGAVQAEPRQVNHTNPFVSHRATANDWHGRALMLVCYVHAAPEPEPVDDKTSALIDDLIASVAS